MLIGAPASSRFNVRGIMLPGWIPVLVLSLATLCPRCAQAHATLTFPVSRNHEAFLRREFYCPHCGQGGGQGRVPGICGDPFQNSPPFSFATDPSKFYGPLTNMTEGQIIYPSIQMSTNHGGRMAFRVCPLPREQVTQACFDLPGHQLRRVHDNPLYNNKLYSYLNVNNREGSSVVAAWRLPPGVSCANGCMFQWWWWGFQTCYLPCEREQDDVPGECGKNLINLSVVQCRSILLTEQYANCADVVITPSGGSRLPPLPPTPILVRTPPSPISSRSPSPAPSPSQPPTWPSPHQHLAPLPSSPSPSPHSHSARPTLPTTTTTTTSYCPGSVPCGRPRFKP
ncbi:hypothetical protein V8C86DRAFT_1614582 [Haematococcus lacustris]